MVEGYVDGHRVGVSVMVGQVQVQLGVGVAALLEAPAGHVELHHLVGPPGEVIVVVTLLYPVDGQVRAPGRRVIHRVALSRKAQIL